jgi:DNA polymerase-3 subunit delta'
MRVDTANKMLKLIEEPTDRTVMLFVSEQANQLLATIRSRVQMVQVPRLGLEEAAAGLQTRFAVGEEEARGLLHVTDGNIAGALRMRGEEGTDEDYRLFVAWMRACYANDSVTTVALSDDFAKPGREGMKRFVRYALHMLRQCIVGNYGAQYLVRLTDAERQFAVKFAPFIHHGNVLEMQEVLERAHRDIAGNVNGKLVFMDISARLNILLRKAA